jgi:hypothetical protein
VKSAKISLPFSEKHALPSSGSKVRANVQYEAGKKLCLACSQTLKMAAICHFEKPTDYIRTTQRHTAENRHLHTRRCEDLKSYIYIYIYIRFLVRLSRPQGNSAIGRIR